MLFSEPKGQEKVAYMSNITFKLKLIGGNRWFNDFCYVVSCYPLWR